MRTDNAATSILLVEDNQVVRDVLREALEAAGFACTAVGDGAAALEKLQREEYALVLSDIEMPGISGLALAETLRECKPTLPVLLMSGVAGYEEQALQAGARAVLLKPFPLLVAVEHVRAALA